MENILEELKEKIARKNLTSLGMDWFQKLKKKTAGVNGIQNF